MLNVSRLVFVAAAEMSGTPFRDDAVHLDLRERKLLDSAHKRPFVLSRDKFRPVNKAFRQIRPNSWSWATLDSRSEHFARTHERRRSKKQIEALTATLQKVSAEVEMGNLRRKLPPILTRLLLLSAHWAPRWNRSATQALLGNKEFRANVAMRAIGIIVQVEPASGTEVGAVN